MECGPEVVKSSCLGCKSQWVGCLSVSVMGMPNWTCGTCFAGPLTYFWTTASMMCPSHTSSYQVLAAGRYDQGLQFQN